MFSLLFYFPDGLRLKLTDKNKLTKIALLEARYHQLGIGWINLAWKKLK